MTWEIRTTEKELKAYGDGYVAGMNDGLRNSHGVQVEPDADLKPEQLEVAATVCHEKYIELQAKLDALLNQFKTWYYHPDVLSEDGYYTVPAALVDEWLAAIEAVA